MKPAPATAIACLLHHQGRLLLCRRPNSPQQNHWQCPGGFIHLGESLAEAGQRILKQQLGISLDLYNSGLHTNNIFPDKATHTVTLYLHGSCLPEHIRQPQWQWFDWQQLPQPLFLPLEILSRQAHHEVCGLIGHTRC